MAETKKLTDAQKAHLLKLLQVRDAAQANLDAFIAYLTAEHGIDAKNGWTLDVKDGFTRPAQEPSDGDH
jgi:hypothetical protein